MSLFRGRLGLSRVEPNDRNDVQWVSREKKRHVEDGTLQFIGSGDDDLDQTEKGRRTSGK